jgi:hypothetical protein
VQPANTGDPVRQLGAVRARKCRSKRRRLSYKYKNKSRLARQARHSKTSIVLPLLVTLLLSCFVLPSAPGHVQQLGVQYEVRKLCSTTPATLHGCQGS